MTTSESVEILVYDVAVRADCRRQGIGRKLVNELRDRAAEAGVLNVCVPADKSDQGALDFYRALGGLESDVSHFLFHD